jgi:CheY-like chemotaxis protein
MHESRDDNLTPDVHASRVLLVEDIAAMRMYLRLALERTGAHVMEAENLKQARSWLRDGARPTSVLLDMDLPDGHGLDLIRELPCGVPVVALTADDSRETALRCRDAGCAAVLFKGERLADLGRVLTEIECGSGEFAFAPVHDPVLTRRYITFLAEAHLDLGRRRARGDFDSVRRIAHRLSGTAVHFGYAGIGASARLLGTAIASGQPEQISAAVSMLAERLLDAVEAEWLGRASGSGNRRQDS